MFLFAFGSIYGLFGSIGSILIPLFFILQLFQHLNYHNNTPLNLSYRSLQRYTKYMRWWSLNAV